MFKLFVPLFICLNLMAVEPFTLQFTGIDVTHAFLDKTQKDIKIQREISSECLDIPMYPETFSQENISKNISKNCKKEFITTKGVIQPFTIDKDIQTVGEIEVMDFIYSKSSMDPDKYILVDSRKAIWFDQETIPSAVNVPTEDLIFDEDFKDEFEKAYKNLGIKILSKATYDFSNAKTAIFFCNGPWCPVSKKGIKHLISIGYPKDKILWYRGGMEGWKSLSLTTVKR